MLIEVFWLEAAALIEALEKLVGAWHSKCTYMISCARFERWSVITRWESCLSIWLSKVLDSQRFNILRVNLIKRIGRDLRHHNLKKRHTHIDRRVHPLNGQSSIDLRVLVLEVIV